MDSVRERLQNQIFLQYLVCFCDFQVRPGPQNYSELVPKLSLGASLSAALEKRRHKKAFQKVVHFRKARGELSTTPPPGTERGATCFACSQEGNPFLEAWGEGKFCWASVPEPCVSSF